MPQALSISAYSPPQGVLTLRGGDASRQRVGGIFFGRCPDGELIAAEAQTARCAVLPLHENLKLVGVPDDTSAANADSVLLDLISPVGDRVGPQLHLTSPPYARRKLADAVPAPTGAWRLPPASS